MLTSENIQSNIKKLEEWHFYRSRSDGTAKPAPVYATIQIPADTAFQLETDGGEKTWVTGNGEGIPHGKGDYILVGTKLDNGVRLPDFDDRGQIVNGHEFDELYKSCETGLLYKTKDGRAPGREQRVYFSCHKNDFEKTFSEVCKDIFKTHDSCTIYYKEDPAGELPILSQKIDLERMNLFVFPVTLDLVHGGNPAADSDLAYANAKNKPILPIMFETEPDSILKWYSKPEMFYMRQYLSKYTKSPAEIPYEEKLKKILDATLINDDTAERIRKAFDAYIFLSYRKKDRQYAKELMILIHSNPEFRNIAIWFDEFISPGEFFDQSIENALKKSELFTLLVTPSLLENDNEGKKNYVQRREYPTAQNEQKPILPIEKKMTDRKRLAEDYASLPAIVDGDDEQKVYAALTEAFRNITRKKNVDDRMHNYLIGLAYLNGIDVESNPEYGVELVTKAAEAELPEAMKKLFDMYLYGIHIALDYKKACEWAEKIYNYCKIHFGEENEDTLVWMNNLAFTCDIGGYYQKAIEVAKQCYELRCKVLGEEDLDTLASLNNYATYCLNQPGCNEIAMELTKKCYQLRCKVLGEKHPDTLISLHTLASCYYEQGKYKIATELAEKCYNLQLQLHGEGYTDTLNALNLLAISFDKLGDHQKAAELGEKCYKLHCKVLGEEDPRTLKALNNLATYYIHPETIQKGYELIKKCYDLRSKVLGSEHPETLDTLCNRVTCCYYLGEYQEALELAEKCYKTKCRILGGKHPATLLSLNKEAGILGQLRNLCVDEKDYPKAFEIQKRIYDIACSLYGKTHSSALRTFCDYAVFGSLIDTQQGYKLFCELYEMLCDALGDTHKEELEACRELLDANKLEMLRRKMEKLIDSILTNQS